MHAVPLPGMPFFHFVLYLTLQILAKCHFLKIPCLGDSCFYKRAITGAIAAAGIATKIVHTAVSIESKLKALIITKVKIGAITSLIIDTK